jgi:hypothetical protein
MKTLSKGIFLFFVIMQGNDSGKLIANERVQVVDAHGQPIDARGNYVLPPRRTARTHQRVPQNDAPVHPNMNAVNENVPAGNVAEPDRLQTAWDACKTTALTIVRILFCVDSIRHVVRVVVQRGIDPHDEMLTPAA